VTFWVAVKENRIIVENIDFGGEDALKTAEAVGE
jgi:hypothetical protein